MPNNRTAYPSREERWRHGRSCRTKVGRVRQGEWDPNLRKFDALELLLDSQKGRFERLLPIKYTRMAVSPFGYFRGSVPIMAADLASLPHTGLLTQICGDAHVRNLGAYAGMDGRLIFDINDFDETILGPWEWDVKRMCASLVLAGRESSHSERGCRDAVFAFARQYRETMAQFATMAFIDLARYQVFRHLRVSPILTVLGKAERATPEHNLQKLTNGRIDGHRFREQKPLQYRIPRTKAVEVLEALNTYKETLSPERRHFFSQYRPHDVGFRVVGTGSVGTLDYIVLMFGDSLDDPLFMQIKEEVRSAYARYLPHSHVPMHEGQRVAEGARAMQVQSDIFLGWTSLDGRDFLVRQLRDHKAGIEDADLGGNGLEQYAMVCGELLAKGHARSGDPCAINGYLGNSAKFERSMARFGITYADQSTRDYEQFVQAIRNGKLPTMAASAVQLQFTLAKGKKKAKGKAKSHEAAAPKQRSKKKAAKPAKAKRASAR